MGELTARVTSLQDRLGVVEGLLSMQQEHDREREKSRTEVISPEQLETLLARMTLAENKVSLLDAQVTIFLFIQISMQHSNFPELHHYK